MTAPRSNRRLLTIATAEFDSPQFPALPDVASEVQAWRDWLCDPGLGDAGYVDHAASLSENPDKTLLRQVLESPGRAAKLKSGDFVICYVTGHGHLEHSELWLVLSDTEPDRLYRTAQSARELLGWLWENDLDHGLVVIDVCYAGAALETLLRHSHEQAHRWTMVLATTPRRTARCGALTGALKESLEDAKLGKFGEQRFLSPDQFLTDVRRRMRAAKQTAYVLLADVDGDLLPNPGYRAEADPKVVIEPDLADMAMREEDFRAHWGPRARGVAGAEEPGWFFAGRDVLMRRLVEFCAGPPGALVVSGPAGCGKSAVLSRLVTLSDLTFRERHATRFTDVPADLVPEPGSIDVAVLAAGKTAGEVLAQIHSALCTGGSELFEQRLSEVNAVLGQTPGCTIVLDGLDEAQDPVNLTSALLARLDNVRLVVGVRSPAVKADRDDAAPSELADLVVAELRAEVAAADAPPYWSDEDLETYITSLLPDAEQRETAAPADLVTTVAAATTPSYLAARVAVLALTADGRLPSPGDPVWEQVSDHGLVGLLRREIAADLPDPGDRFRARCLLRALAFAKGPGLPWLDVWPAMATAVADGQYLFGDRDIAWLLTLRLTAYLSRDIADGITVYRLFHAALADALRSRPATFLDGEDLP